MPFLMATEPGRADHANEDFAAVSAHCAVLLDGVSGPPDGDDGCSHGVAWHVRRLGALLLAGMDAGTPLRTALAEAIGAAAALHADTCDLSHRDTPSATVAAVRIHPGQARSGGAGTAAPGGMPGTGAPPVGENAVCGWLEYLVLSDSALLVADPGPGPDLRTGPLREVDGIGLVTDTRLDVLRDDLCRRGEEAEEVRRWRGVPGGFWTAGADPRAADEALVGTTALSRFALMTDGATRAVEVFGDLDWGQALSLVSDEGPRALIERVRALEVSDPLGRTHPRSKVHDDATIVLWKPESLAS